VLAATFTPCAINLELVGAVVSKGPHLRDPRKDRWRLPPARTHGPAQHGSVAAEAARCSAWMADGALRKHQALPRSQQLKGKEDPGSWQGAFSWALLP